MVLANTDANRAAPASATWRSPYPGPPAPGEAGRSDCGRKRASGNRSCARGAKPGENDKGNSSSTSPGWNHCSPNHSGVLPGGVCAGRTCLVRRGNSVRKGNRGQAETGRVLQRMVGAIPGQLRYNRCRAWRGAARADGSDDISITAIASGRYDAYLTSYAQAVRAYRHPVILSFGHEMNGIWFSWGYRHTSPAVFVAAWRHIVTLFRAVGTRNVTWLWTVNIIKTQHGQIPSPAPWWPGSSYVTWVGIDGYYLKPSWQFVPIFGPTIAAVRELTGDPILIAETSATPAASQPAKIPDLFAGIHTYGLLGFVWFDDVASHDYRINGPAAIAASPRSGRCQDLQQC